ncbi:MAG: oxidoreductase, partial [Gammaproteobacteria bacterium]
DIPIEDALAQLAIFDEHYQAATDKPEPLFRRRG